ncbi:MAG: hypothetical protein ABRQ39_30995 [Candidatus Eremiobacterota bacterium]
MKQFYINTALDYYSKCQNVEKLIDNFITGKMSVPETESLMLQTHIFSCNGNCRNIYKKKYFHYKTDGKV